MKFFLPVFLAAVLVVAGWFALRSYTRHDAIVRVPDVAGMTMNTAQEALGARQLGAIVIDSVYREDGIPGSVVDQDPDAGSEVKPGRKVYLVMNALQPPMIDMPQLEDLSKRQALSVLEILGLRVAGMAYRPDPCVDCVLEQQLDGQRILAGARVRRGAAVTLVLGSGANGERVPVPDLLGLNGAELSTLLNMASLNRGLVVVCDGCNTQGDSALARVYRQSPAPRSDALVPMGSPIDVWLTMDTTGLRPKAGWSDPGRYATNDSINAVE
ncbi:MAG: PASTA domain-containing protein [Flavobacteriales bacterium]